MTLPRPVRIVGSGSDWGDDAVAWEVITQLRRQVGERPDLELFAVHGIEQILGALDAHGTLIIVDAVSSGAPPGTIHRFDWPDRRLRLRRANSTHGLDAGTVLDLAAVLGVLPSRVFVCGIEAQCVGGGAALHTKHGTGRHPSIRRLRKRRLLRVSGGKSSHTHTQPLGLSSRPPLPAYRRAPAGASSAKSRTALSVPVRAAVPELVRRLVREVASPPPLLKGCVDGVQC